MLTPEDIKNLTEYQKQIFVTKDDFEKGIEKLQQNFSTLQTSVDGFAKDTDNHEKAIEILNYKAKNTEDWIGQASPKLGLKYEA